MVSVRDTYHPVIRGFKSKRTEKIARGLSPKGFQPDLLRRTRAMLVALNAAVELEDLRFPPGNHLEKLSGDRKGRYSVRVNRRWRICFVWTDSGPDEVEVVDYH